MPIPGGAAVGSMRGSETKGEDVPVVRSVSQMRPRWESTVSMEFSVRVVAPFRRLASERVAARETSTFGLGLWGDGGGKETR